MPVSRKALRLLHHFAARIRSEDFHPNGFLFHDLERLLNARFFAVSLEIEEEQVTRFGAAERKGLDPGEVDVVRLEGVEGIGQGAGRVRNLQEQRGAVAPAGDAFPLRQ